MKVRADENIIIIFEYYFLKLIILNYIFFELTLYNLVLI